MTKYAKICLNMHKKYLVFCANSLEKKGATANFYAFCISGKNGSIVSLVYLRIKVQYFAVYTDCSSTKNKIFVATILRSIPHVFPKDSHRKKFKKSSF